MTNAMINDLNALQPVGINRGNLVRKVIEHLDEAQLLAVKSWAEPVTKRGLRRSKRYTVSDGAYAKVQRLRDAQVPVFDLIRHGIAVYLSLPHDMLFRDISLLLDWKKQEVKRRQLRDRQTRQTVDIKRASTEMIASPILASLDIDRKSYIEALAIRMRRGELGPIDASDLARRFGLTDAEIATVSDLAGDVHIGLGAPDRPGITEFSSGSLAVEARSRLTKVAHEGVTRAEEARLQSLAAARARLQLEKLGPFPHVEDEDACRAWLEHAAASLSKSELDQLWRQFLAKRTAAQHNPAPHHNRSAIEAHVRATATITRRPIPGTDYEIEEHEIPGTVEAGPTVEALIGAPAPLDVRPIVPGKADADFAKLGAIPDHPKFRDGVLMCPIKDCPMAAGHEGPHYPTPAPNYIMDIGDNGIAYVRDGTKTLIGKFAVPAGTIQSTKAIPEAGIVEVITDEGKQTVQLEPISDEEKIVLADALQDHAIFELITLELEEKFALRSDEPITESHMVELYAVVRDRIFQEIDKGSLPGFTKDQAETVFARTMLRLRKKFDLPAFDLIDSGDEQPPGFDAEAAFEDTEE